MAKLFKNTHMSHMVCEYNNKMTVCGLRITQFSNIVNKDGISIPATKEAYQFEPFKSDRPICKKCKTN
jgi:hypothetical protein